MPAAMESLQNEPICTACCSASSCLPRSVCSAIPPLCHAEAEKNAYQNSKASSTLNHIEKNQCLHASLASGFITLNKTTISLNNILLSTTILQCRKQAWALDKSESMT